MNAPAQAIVKVDTASSINKSVLEPAHQGVLMTLTVLASTPVFKLRFLPQVDSVLMYLHNSLPQVRWSEFVPPMKQLFLVLIQEAVLLASALILLKLFPGHLLNLFARWPVPLILNVLQAIAVVRLLALIKIFAYRYLRWSPVLMVWRRVAVASVKFPPVEVRLIL